VLVKNTTPFADLRVDLFSAGGPLPVSCEAAARERISMFFQSAPG